MAVAEPPVLASPNQNQPMNRSGIRVLPNPNRPGRPGWEVDFRNGICPRREPSSSTQPSCQFRFGPKPLLIGRFRVCGVGRELARVIHSSVASTQLLAASLGVGTQGLGSDRASQNFHGPLATGAPFGLPFHCGSTGPSPSVVVVVADTASALAFPPRPARASDPAPPEPA